MLIKNSKNGKKLFVNSNSIEKEMSYAQNNNIKEIVIYEYENIYNLNNIDFVKDYTFIERITISMWDNIDYSAVHYLKNLKELHINLVGRDKNEIDFKFFPNLEELFMEWNNKRKNIEKLEKIKSLGIVRLKKADLKLFSHLKSLIILQVLQSSLENLDGISELNILEELDLYNNRKLASLIGIGKLKKLRKLNINNCKLINDLNEIAELENLEEIEFCNCGDIESLKPLSKLKNLKLVDFSGNTNILDGDLSPCKGIKSVGFMERKHYTHKYADLNIR